ncbi:hypothetical protein Angca_007895, partial [Angiostrongylus cantonensis]
MQLLWLNIKATVLSRRSGSSMSSMVPTTAFTLFLFGVFHVEAEVDEKKPIVLKGYNLTKSFIVRIEFYNIKSNNVTNPLQPSTAAPLQSTTDEPFPPTTEEPLQPTTDEPFPPTTEESLQPTTGEPFQPTTDEPLQPTTDEPFHPTTKEPLQPTTGEPFQSTTEEPFQPTTSEPFQPTTDEPLQPTTSEPFHPATCEPFQPTTGGPLKPTTSEPLQPGADKCKLDNGMNDEVRNSFLSEHNRLRSLTAKGLAENPLGTNKYAPKAARMLKMVYDCKVEESAAKHAKKCEFKHSSGSGNGENLWVIWPAKTNLTDMATRAS